MEHRRVRGRRVAGEDRLDDGGVLGVRPRGASLGAELRAAERREPATQAGGEVGQDLVVRAGIDLGVKADIRGGIASRSSRSTIAAIASCVFCRRRRSIGVMLIAASRAQVASISAIAPNNASSCADVAVATVAPRRGLTSIRPVEASCRSASRTGVRDTP